MIGELARCFSVVTEARYQKSLSVDDDDRLRIDAVYATQGFQLLGFRVIKASRDFHIAEIYLNKNHSPLLKAYTYN